MNSKTKIFCFVLPSFFKENKGGAELQCYYLAQELIRRGWEVHYIREYRNKSYNKSYTVDNIKIHGLKNRRSELRWINKRQLYKLMIDIKANYYYCRASISYVYPVVQNAKKIGSTTVIWACSHDNELKNIKKGKIITQIFSKFNKILFKKALPKVDYIVLQTNHQKKLLKNQYNLSGIIIYNAHPNPKSSLQVGYKKDTIVWIGRLQEWKHPEKFIHIAEKFSNRPYKFIAIGKPLKNNNLVDLMLDSNKKLSNFEFTGELSNSDVCQIISEARLLVCTSDYEGFSNTFIEAWARGVPVVSLNVDPDNLLHNKNIGLLSGCYDQLIKDIDLLMQNNEKWKELSYNSLMFFKTNLTINRSIDEFENKIFNTKR